MAMRRSSAPGDTWLPALAMKQLVVFFWSSHSSTFASKSPSQHQLGRQCSTLIRKRFVGGPSCLSHSQSLLHRFRRAEADALSLDAILVLWHLRQAAR